MAFENIIRNRTYWTLLELEELQQVVYIGGMVLMAVIVILALLNIKSAIDIHKIKKALYKTKIKADSTDGLPNKTVADIRREAEQENKKYHDLFDYYYKRIINEFESSKSDLSEFKIELSNYEFESVSFLLYSFVVYIAKSETKHPSRISNSLAVYVASNFFHNESEIEGATKRTEIYHSIFDNSPRGAWLNWGLDELLNDVEFLPIIAFGDFLYDNKCVDDYQNYEFSFNIVKMTFLAELLILKIEPIIKAMEKDITALANGNT